MRSAVGEGRRAGEVLATTAARVGVEVGFGVAEPAAPEEPLCCGLPVAAPAVLMAALRVASGLAWLAATLVPPPAKCSYSVYAENVATTTDDKRSCLIVCTGPEFCTG